MKCRSNFLQEGKSRPVLDENTTAGRCCGLRLGSQGVIISWLHFGQVRVVSKYIPGKSFPGLERCCAWPGPCSDKFTSHRPRGQPQGQLLAPFWASWRVLMTGRGVAAAGKLEVPTMPSAPSLRRVREEPAVLSLQFTDRVRLFLMPAKHQPDLLYLRHVPLRRVHLFTTIQVLCLAVLWVLKSTVAAIIFPVMVRHSR